MKKFCLCFQLHQPYRLRRYRFFDIGHEHAYEDEFQNADVFQRIATECYAPANRLMLELLKQYPDFHISYVISGMAIEQMEIYYPALLDSFRELASTGRVEFLAEPYAHSLASLYDEEEFRAQVQLQQEKLREVFGCKPSRVLCNTELVYSDDHAGLIKSMGYEAVLTEGAKHVLGWKSPNYLYHAAPTDSLTLLLRNASATDMIVKDFCNYASHNYPVTADRLVDTLRWAPEGEEFSVLYMNYEVLGSIHKAESGIFQFFRALPMIATERGIGFATPSQILDEHQSVAPLSITHPITTAGEEKSTKDWTSNVLQQGVLRKFEEWGQRVRLVDDRYIRQAWLYLQSADHLYYMNTSGSGKGFSPYSSAYDAFNNYMNVLSDFLLRVEEAAPLSYDVQELESYELTIKNQDTRIAVLEAELAELKREQSKPKRAPRTKAKQNTDLQ